MFLWRHICNSCLEIVLSYHSANTEDNARLDIAESVLFLGGGFRRHFFM